MSQKNETKILVIASLITLALIAVGVGWFTKFKSPSTENTSTSNQSPTTPSESEISLTQSEQERFSAGERLLITSDTTPDKEAGIKAIAQKNYDEAVAQLESSLEAQPNDPEALIYLNNARIGEQKSYTIAASMPIGKELGAAQEMLRGVAQAQTEINQAGGIGGVPLKVLIINDDNEPEVAQQVAQTLVKNSAILGVIGHLSSRVTLAAAEVYQQEGLVMITPTSTSVALSGAGEYIFRTVPSDRFAGDTLADYLLKKLKQQNAAVFFNSESDYSKSLKDVFTTALLGAGGRVVDESDFADSNFNAADAVKQAMDSEAEVLMLAPDSGSGALDKALLVVQVNDGRLPMLAGDSAYKLKTLQIGGKEAEGMILAVPWHILGDPKADFPQAAKGLWGGDVNWRTALAYDATQALIAGLNQEPTRKGIQKTLAAPGFSVPGAGEEIRFLPSGDRNQKVQLVTIKPGNSSGSGYDFVPIK
ncbi:MAG: ABC transporter substrate-binding protein [Symploca sp. SIO2E6]|nr:ABC transporter substrate-binding protein [Symploca sp. SIO2E6]